MIRVTNDAEYRIGADGNHVHAGVIEETLGGPVEKPKPPYRITMKVRERELVCA